MSGKYLRKRVPGQPQDPTMTHVDDPWTFNVGDCIQDNYGRDLICWIDNNVFGNPDIRFAHLVEMGDLPLPPGTRIHDVRSNDEETRRQYRETVQIYVLPE